MNISPASLSQREVPLIRAAEEAPLTPVPSPSKKPLPAGASLAAPADITHFQETLSIAAIGAYKPVTLDLAKLEESGVNVGSVYQGKVRTNYHVNASGRPLMISEASDRTSAFDIPNLIPQVPYKGKVLDTISNHWANRVEQWGYKTDVVRDHGLSIDSNAAVTVREPLQTLPIEFVVRKYLTGNTGTSLAKRYFADGERNFGDFKLADDLKLHDRLDRTILTPTTKEKEDRNVDKNGAVDFILQKAAAEPEFDRALERSLVKLQGQDPSLAHMTLYSSDDKKLLATKLYEKIEKMVTDVFDRAEAELKPRGVLLVDTKFELGIDKDGGIRFMDELLTPDSSRYWSKKSLEEARQGNEQITEQVAESSVTSPKDLFKQWQFPASVDKDLMRNVARIRAAEFETWKAENADIIKANQGKAGEAGYQPYKSQFFTDAEVQKLANGYLHVLKTITGKELNLKS